MYLECHRRLTPEQRFRYALEYSAIVREMAMAVLRHQYPRASEREIFLREARQRLGSDLFHKAYGDELTDERTSRGGID